VNKRLVLIFLVLLIPIIGCSEKDTHETCDDAVSFTDALGRVVEIPKKPERVAALIGSFAEIWQLSGGEIVATAEDGWEDFGLELDGAVNLGGAHSPSLEALLSASPDLVLASASTASNVEMCGVLEEAGIQVVYFDVASFDDYLEMLRLCTEITGRADLYGQNGEALKKRIDLLKQECNTLGEKEKKVLVLRVSSGSVKAKGSRGTVLGEMLSDIGCVNVADSDKTLLENLSVESVIRQEPYRIFVVTMGSDTEKSRKNLERMIESDPAWSSLEALREGRVHIMDKRLFNLKPNAKWAKAYEELIAILCEK